MFKKRLKSHHDSTSMLDSFIQKERVDKEYFLNLLNSTKDEKSKVLYIHVPYCDKICSFCNLNRKQLDNDLEDYTNYLLKEIEEKANTLYVKKNIFEAIYFGGGTPSILKDHQIEKILKAIKSKFNLHEEYEWTFETTIHNLNSKKIELFNKYGVNRLSVGIQTFSDKGRKFLNRTYSKLEVIDKIKKLRTEFNGLVCADIIYNYENQSIEEVVEDAKLIKELNFDSVSFYSLMIYEGSQLSKENIELNPTDEDFERYLAFYTEMKKGPNWEILELTKFLQKGKDKYKYINLRNNGADTLVIGIGAGGNVQNLVTFNMNEKISFYLKESPQHIKYRKFSGLLQFENYEFSKIKKILNEEAFETFLACLRMFEKQAFGSLQEERFQLNSKGIFWGNNISHFISNRLMEGEFKNVEKISMPHGHGGNKPHP